MVITFPNMGNVAIAAAALCQGLHVPYIAPEANSKETLRLGSYYAPEEICLPFKLVLGNVLSCVEQGADTVLLTGSCGPCRYGEYCELLRKALDRLGHTGVELIVADFSHEIGTAELRRRVRRVTDSSPVGALAQSRALYDAYRVVSLCDKLDAELARRAGYEANAGDCLRLLREYKSLAAQSKRPEDTFALLAEYGERARRIPTDDRKKPLRVAVIGEIFTVIDPFSNLFIEEKLMGYGVSSRRMLSPSWWVKDLLLKTLRLNSREIGKAAGEYLPYQVGGHCKECVGEAVLAGRQGMDGAIQIYPMGCMPEVIAKSIFPAIQKAHDMPIMTLVVDESTGEAGYITRIEAFLDMLHSRRKKRSAPVRP